MSFINGTKLDERLIRIDIDPGFVNGRQYGRGRSGGQVMLMDFSCMSLNNQNWIVVD